MKKENNSDDPLGEDGISLEENDQASRYNCHQIYYDLISIGYSNEEALKSMKITQAFLNKLKKEFGG